MLLEQVKELNIYNLIGVLVLCIIVYIVVSYSLNNVNIDIGNINTKFEKNKKLNNINFTKITINKNIVDISISKVVDYINKYLEKKYNQDYDLIKNNVSKVIMGYNKEYKLYKINYILDLKLLVLDVLLYLDKNNEVYISSITKQINNKDLDLDLDIDIDNNLDLLDLFKDTNKLFNITNKIKDMKNNGYSLVVEDPTKKKENNNIISGGNKDILKLYEDEDDENDIVGNDIFLNGDNICEGCTNNSEVITCDIKKDLYSQYALF